jgi:O-antigen/teichoic acid export membrane protein
MLAALARNTAVSVMAFGVNGLILLILVPIIVGAYGLALFGLIVIARIFLPSGALAIFDLGISETATYAVGRARGSGEWAEASQQIGVLLALSVAVGIGMAVLLALAAPFLAGWFAVPADARDGFVGLLTVTAACQVVLFPGLMAEGILKGFERFVVLRGLEVVNTLAYAGVTVACVAAGVSYVGVGYAFVGTMAARYLVLVALALVEMRRAGARPAKWTLDARRAVLNRSALMFQNKILGALQAPVPPLVIGLLLGPAAVGVYEIVTRLPRLLKSALSILASAVLPVAARLEGQGDEARLGAAGLKSFWLVPYVTFPVLFATGTFAQPLLELWVGTDLAAYWPWMAVMLAFPLASVSLAVAQAMSLTRPQYIAAANRVSLGGIVVQYAVSLALVHSFGAMSFVAGVAIAVIATFPFHLRLVARSLSFSASQALRLLAGHLVLVAVVTLGVAAVASLRHPNPALLAAAFGAAVLCYWAAAYVVLLPEAGRSLVRRLISAVLHPVRA